MHPAIVTDVPALVNGRKAQLSANIDALEITFTASGDTRSVERKHIQHIAVMDGYVGVCLHPAQCIVPGTKKMVHSFTLSRAAHCCREDWLLMLQWCAECGVVLDCTEERTISLETACKRTQVYVKNDGSAVVLWTKNSCTVLQALKAIVLQRTTGGMSTYDAHIIPCAGTIATVDMLPHSTVSVWDETFGSNMVVNAGADPVHPRDIAQAQFVPSVHEFIAGVQCMHEDSLMSSEGSEWSACDTSEDDSSDDDSCDDDSSDDDCTSDEFASGKNAARPIYVTSAEDSSSEDYTSSASDTA